MKEWKKKHLLDLTFFSSFVREIVSLSTKSQGILKRDGVLKDPRRLVGGSSFAKFFTYSLLFFKDDEALVAEEMRRTTEAAVSEDTMFEEPASGTDQQTSLIRELLRVNFLNCNV